MVSPGADRTPRPQLVMLLGWSMEWLHTTMIFFLGWTVYEKNADCISRQHTEEEVCAEQAVNNFKMQSEATSNIDALMSFQCM